MIVERSENRPETTARAPQTTPVTCRRLGRPMPLEDHRACPYCFGGDADIAQGQHRHFCDYEPGTDPVCFGFPSTVGRLVDG